MTAKELKRIFSKGECLSLDVLRLYNDGKLNKKSMHEVEKHLLECNLCSGAVDGLNSKRIAEVNKLSEHIQRLLAVYMNTPPRIPFFRRFGFIIISAAFLIGVGGIWLYYSQYQKKNTLQIADTTNKNQKQIQSFNLPINNNSVPVENQNTTAVVASESDKNNASEKVSGNASTKMQNLPAETPGQLNTLTVKQETVTPPTTTQDESTTGPTTRTVEINKPIRIKSVQIYPAVTHNDKQGRNDAKDGQLGRASSSKASFELDEMPFFPGGTEALRNYITNNFKPTVIDRSKLTRFSTGVMFVVNSKTGAITYSEISFDVAPEIDKELLRVINAMPKWSPGKKRGEVDIMIGVTFE